jgi:O-acetyl-ADP-ribose deacetylase (regulator of RNase III)
MLEAVREGDIVAQPVDGIVNAWKRKLPWWILVPSGVAGAIRSAAGTAPFRELAKHGPMPVARRGIELLEAVVAMLTKMITVESST